MTSAFNEKNQLTSSSGGGALKVRGTLNEPGTAKVNGSPEVLSVANKSCESSVDGTGSGPRGGAGGSVLAARRD